MQRVKPLLKWPGGKSEELPAIVPLIPDHRRYVEPFVGGGALYFHLEPKHAVINDVNTSLTSLYRQLGDFPNTDLPRTLRDLALVWHQWADIADKNVQQIAPTLRVTPDEQLFTAAQTVAGQLAQQLVDPSWLVGDIEAFEKVSAHRLSDKIRRIRRSEAKAGEAWAADDVVAQTATALRSALYYWLRDHLKPSTAEERAAVFFFLREFAYGGMFRFNANGRFNVPYGGRSYDGKDLTAKVDRMLSPSVRDLLARTDVQCGPAVDVLAAVTDHDFVFLDPPYDSPFSSYDQHPFTQEHHREIANMLRITPAKFLMVVGATPFIESLYRDVQSTSSMPVIIEEYEKTYAYTIKGRNNRNARHLAIRNYTI